MDFNTLKNNPEKFGFPSAQQFISNPEKYIELFRGKETNVFDIVSNGSTNAGIRAATKSIKYTFRQYKSTRLEEIERIAKDSGVNLRQMQFKAVINNEGGQNGEIVVRFMENEEFERRSKW